MFKQGVEAFLYVLYILFILKFLGVLTLDIQGDNFYLSILTRFGVFAMKNTSNYIDDDRERICI